jgi:hypothetical protein
VIQTRERIFELDSTTTYVPLTVTMVHGETDFMYGQGDHYQAHIEEWQREELSFDMLQGLLYNYEMILPKKLKSQNDNHKNSDCLK